MTNKEAIKQLKKCKSFHNGSYGEALNMAIKALEQQPNRCDSCVHSEEQDGSNCYECVKGMADNFEAQPTDVDCISRAQALHACCDEWNKDYKAIMKSIRQLPSVAPKADSEWGSIGNNADLETVPTNLQDWLSSFNTDSATECFTAVQRLKESVNDRLDEGNTR